MIIIPAHALWTLLGIWLAVCICTFMFGWYASAYRHGEAEAERRQADRNKPCHPECFGPTCRCHRKTDDYRAYHRGELPRAGRLPLDASFLITETVRQPDPARWWPALERHARADTAPFSRVETSNWEANKKRAMDAWLHERGMQ